MNGNWWGFVGNAECNTVRVSSVCDYYFLTFWFGLVFWVVFCLVGFFLSLTYSHNVREKSLFRLGTPELQLKSVSCKREKQH